MPRRSATRSAKATCRRGTPMRRKGTFLNERGLIGRRRATLIAWANDGAPEGDAKDLPAAPAFADGWAIGKPDVVLRDAGGLQGPGRRHHRVRVLLHPDELHRTEVDSGRSRCGPGNREVVHHVLAFYRAKPDMQRTARCSVRTGTDGAAGAPRRRQGTRPQREDRDAEPPRSPPTRPAPNPQVLRPGTAIRLEPGGVIELQMHYTTNGKAATDRTRIGLLFAKDPSPREVRVTPVLQRHAHASGRRPTRASTPTSRSCSDAIVWGIFPHTHVRGKKWEYVLELPDGTKKTILSVPRYDFNWQTYYMFTEPLQVPKGIEARLDAPGTTTRRRTSRIRIRKSTSSGAIRPGKRCSTPVSSSARRRRRAAASRRRVREAAVA